MPVPPRSPRDVGAGAVATFRRSLSEKLAEIIRRDPERAANAVEVGLIDQRWLDDPTDRRVSTATPFEVVQRFLERSVEQRPSLIGTVGLNTLQVLAFHAGDEGPGTSQPVTVVFTDLEGFTAYTSKEGDDAAIALLHDHHRAIGPVVRSRGGRVVKRLGDGLMLSFPEPEAAVLAAVELLDTAPDPLRLRAGVHSGDAVVTVDDVVGHVVNVAARVTEEAGGGVVLVTADVHDAVGDLRGVTWGKEKQVRLKGIPDKVTLLRALPA
jgi:adenylate cyclase